MKIRAAAFTVMIVLAAGIPFAAKRSPARPFFVPAPVILNGAGIPEGMYQLVLETNDSSVRVELWRDGRFIATARGSWVKSGMKFKENTLLLRVNPDGSRSLIELRLAGVSKTIVLNNSSEAIIQLSAK